MKEFFGGCGLMKNEYEYIPGFLDTNNKPVLGRDITESFGPFVANKLISGEKINEMNFPRLRMPRLKGMGYFYDDYKTIGNLITEKKIRIYEPKASEKINFNGVYQWKKNYFVFSPNLIGSPETYLGTIIHEATHAIQDYRKWRENTRDREVDAHFAAALYMVKVKKEQFLKAAKYYDYINLAKLVLGDEKFYKTLDFGKKVGKLQQKISMEYNYQWKDDIEKIEQFQKKERWDGILA